jgi:hypothetical protein
VYRVEGDVLRRLHFPVCKSRDGAFGVVVDAQTCVQVDGVFAICPANQASQRQRVWAPDGGPSDRLPLSGSPTGWEASSASSHPAWWCSLACILVPFDAFNIVKRLHFSEIDVSLSDSPTVSRCIVLGEQSNIQITTFDD